MLVKPHTQLAVDRSTFKNHQPRVTQEADLVQCCWKKRAETPLASYRWAHLSLPAEQTGSAPHLPLPTLLMGTWASHCLQWSLSTATVGHSSALQKAGFGSCSFSTAWGKKLIIDLCVLQLPTRKHTNVTSSHSKTKEVIEFWGRAT